MGEKLVGKYIFTGDDGPSIIKAISDATSDLVRAGFDPDYYLNIQQYLSENESPHMGRVPSNQTAKLLTYIDKSTQPPTIRASVEVDPDKLSKDQLYNIITGPEQVGGKMSRGDKSLLKKFFG